MTFVSLILVAILAKVVFRHTVLKRELESPHDPVPHVSSYPSLTVIRPIKGIDADAADNLDALLHSEYPGELQILFVIDDEHDPACAVVRTALAAGRHRVSAELVVAGAPPRGRTGKLNAMIVGLASARGELVAFSDSDTRPGPDLLRRMVATLLTTPGAGDVFVPVIVSNPLQTAGEVGYALLQNAWYGPTAAREARRMGSMPFIMGQTMVFRREALEAIGGLSSADGQIVDDMYLGRRIAESGYKNIMVRDKLPSPIGGMSLLEFVHLFRRWLIFSRSGLPLRFTWTSWWRGAEIWGATLAALYAAEMGSILGFAAALAVLVAAGASQVDLHRVYGGTPISPRHWWVSIAMPLVAPFIALSALVYPKVTWRGRSYALRLAKLAS